MRQFLVGFLIALSASAVALTRHTDGSITLSAQEAAAVEKNFNGMASDLNAAIAIIQRLQHDLEAMKKGKCI
jgi:hypothetical protein